MKPFGSMIRIYIKHGFSLEAWDCNSGHRAEDLNTTERKQGNVYQSEPIRQVLSGRTESRIFSGIQQ